jgi:hypothetical protein
MTMKAFYELGIERHNQDAKWGQQNHDYPFWRVILGEELGECDRAFLEKKPAELRKEMVQAAAVLVAMIECGDRNGWWS